MAVLFNSGSALLADIEAAIKELHAKMDKLAMERDFFRSRAGAPGPQAGNDRRRREVALPLKVARSTVYYQPTRHRPATSI
ncbi:hypothetical protein [Mycobacterium marinum]|uniref:hypothetical protein n=1 Tax=Mycobacterium marinum TaxID=1781 RepID=UPI002358F9F0|nr:hypothetical protein [Mycobacterium marinum]MDC8985583.1 hypothetical protein [Mycobacterium marinum]MDC9002868.1 hypothetical protein [Mycobacterium marinum]MDC9013605.1 hypothetical protein [Mycobacterium marinum]MDC9018970.1 hypothetical protein [Mycobacterium marinum]